MLSYYRWIYQEVHKNRDEECYGDENRKYKEIMEEAIGSKKFMT